MDNMYQPPSNKEVTIYSALYSDPAHLQIFGDWETVYHPEQLEEKNSILILHGGEDISPSIYGQRANKYTHAHDFMSDRDQMEVRLATRAIELGIPIFGICRGAQLACALAGGTLIQHVENHIGDKHEIHTNKGDSYFTTSCHHQMMNPWKINHELIAWAAPKRSKIHLVEDEKDLDIEKEPEVIFFPDIKALAIQGHPEWMHKATPFVNYCLNLVEEKLL